MITREAVSKTRDGKEEVWGEGAGEIVKEQIHNDENTSSYISTNSHAHKVSKCDRFIDSASKEQNNLLIRSDNKNRFLMSFDIFNFWLEPNPFELVISNQNPYNFCQLNSDCL